VDVFIKDKYSYYPLTRIDTVLWNKRSLAFCSAKLLSDLLNCADEKITDAITNNNFIKRNKYSKDDIVSSYNKRYAYPIFEGAVAKRGVYTSLEEFKYNRPSGDRFIIKSTSKEVASLYVVDDMKNEIPTRKVWGVCDGKNMYIMQKGMLFKLYKHGNAFYWLGVKYPDQRMFETPLAEIQTGTEVEPDNVVVTSAKVRLTPFLLRPETGQSY
jgi:hypothetical protein